MIVAELIEKLKVFDCCHFSIEKVCEEDGKLIVV